MKRICRIMLCLLLTSVLALMPAAGVFAAAAPAGRAVIPIRGSVSSPGELWQRIVDWFRGIFASIASFFRGGNGGSTSPDTPDPPTEPDVPPDIPRIVTTMAVFGKGYPVKDGIDRLARIGFEGLDLPFEYMVYDGSPFLGDDYMSWASEMRAYAENAGVPFMQAHAPLDTEHMYVERTIRAASALGVKYLVVHPTYTANGKTITDKDEFIAVNAAEISQWLPLAEEYGVVILSENVVWGASADPRILSELDVAIGSDWHGWCFDTGHAYYKGYTMDVLRECATAPLSLHIQDGTGRGDEHLIPGDGTINWKEFTAALKAVGYRGDCVLEAHHQCMDAPDGERDAILLRLLAAAKSIRADMY